MDSSRYYCLKCSIEIAGQGRPDPDFIASFSDAGSTQSTQYQFEKFIKHTDPRTTYSLNSVFSNPDWNKYVGYMTSTAASGHLEIDAHGRKNWVFLAGDPVGGLYQNNEFISTCPAVALVLSDNASKFHAFPTGYRLDASQCARCGRPIADGSVF
jgi:hypothetical protein